MATSTSTAMQYQRLVSAVPPRPSPRGPPMQSGMPTQATSLQPWRSHSQGAPVTASPRGAKGIAAMQGIESRPPAVRAIVSEIERRSTSQSHAGTVRTDTPVTRGDMTPQRGAAMASSGATTRSASAAAPTASLRIHSNGPPPVAMAASTSARGRRQGDEHDMVFCGSPHTAEDTHVVFGMSPMGRPRGEKAMHVRSGVTPSPSPKGPSVQDRIRQLQGQRR